MAGLSLGRIASEGASRETSSDLERVAEEVVSRMEKAPGQHIQVQRTDPADIPLRSQEGELVFSSSAFSEYLDRVRNDEITRAVFGRVLEHPLASDTKHTRMYGIIVNLMQSLDTLRNHTASSLHRDLVGYLTGNQYVKLYAGASPALTRDSLDATPRIAIRLQTRL